MLKHNGSARVVARAAVAAAALVAGAAGASALLFGSFPVGDVWVEGSEQSADTLNRLWTVDTSRGQVRLGCAPGFYGEENLTAPLAAPVLLRTGDSLAHTSELQDGGTAVELEAGSAEDVSPGQFAIAALDYPAALLAGQCAPSFSQVAVTGVSTAVGEDTVVIFMNLGDKPVNVKVTGYTQGGLLGEVPTITVPRLATVAYRPSAWFPEEGDVALQVDADGVGVVTLLQSTGHLGEVPLGIGYAAAAPLTQTLDFPGAATLPGELNLNLLNPTSEPIEVEVLALSADGEVAVPGFDSFLAEPGAMRVTLPSLPEPAISLRVTSSGGPIGGSLWMQLEGAEDPVAKGKNTQTRTVIPPGQPVDVLPAVTVEDLMGAVEQSGVEDASVRLAVTEAGGALLFEGEAADEAQRGLPGGEPASAAWLIEGTIGGSPVVAVIPVLELAQGGSVQLVQVGP